MKTNKKLNLNTKKVIILSNEQQNAVQGGYSAYCVLITTTAGCVTFRACGQKLMELAQC